MNIWKTLDRLRNMKAAYQVRFHASELMCAKDVSRLLNAPLPKEIAPEQRFSMICCFESAIVKDGLYIHYERDDDSMADYAMRKGAAAIVSAHQVKDYPCILVDDVLSSLRKLLIPMYERINIPATVITGSIGKTTTKNFFNCVYSQKYRTFCNVTNGNTFEYLGFEIQRFDKRAKLFVQEANESDPYNASNCSLVLKPEIAAITNMDKSHIGELGSEENIMKAIASITDGMDENGIVLINGDDPNSNKVTFRQRVIRVAINDKTAQCVADNITEAEDSVGFDVRYNGETAHLVIPVGGVHNVYNAMMAYVAGRLHDISASDIAHGLMKYKPLGFRQNAYRAGRSIIYADCYNSSARSVKSAIGVIAKMKAKAGGKKIAVLGDIAEIEGHEEEIYRDIAKTLSMSDIDTLITYGTDSKTIHSFLTNPAFNSYHADSREALHTLIKQNQTGRDIILFKASRSMGLEQTIKAVFPLAYIRGMLPVWKAYLLWTLKTL